MANGKSYEEGGQGGGSLDLYVSMIGSFLTPKAQGERGIRTSSHRKPPQKRGEMRWEEENEPRGMHYSNRPVRNLGAKRTSLLWLCCLPLDSYHDGPDGSR